MTEAEHPHHGQGHEGTRTPAAPGAPTAASEAPALGTQAYKDLAETGRAPVAPADPQVQIRPLGGAGGETEAGATGRPGKPGRPGWPGRPRPGVASGLGLAKFRDRLTQPPVVRAGQGRGRGPGGRPGKDTTLTVRAEIAEVRFHADLPVATAWTYEGTFPGPTIEVEHGTVVDVDWGNALVDRHGHAAHLPYDVVRVEPLAERPAGGIDANFVEAMAPGGRSTDRGGGTDAHPPLAGAADVTGATVTHLHGAVVPAHSDGWAHNVNLPGQSARCRYPNRQPSATLWYHDHAMAATRWTVHAGLAGVWLIRDEAERALGLPDGDRELVMLLADRNLESAESDPAAPEFTGRLLYKHAGFTDVATGNAGEIPVTGPYNTVNGLIWPTLDVPARWHRLRLVNGSNSRVYRLGLYDVTDEQRPPADSVPRPMDDPAVLEAGLLREALHVIGTDSGLLHAPAHPVDGLLTLGPGERADVLVDFGELAGRTLELRNTVGCAVHAGRGQAESSVMEFTVGQRKGRDRFDLPKTLRPDDHAYALDPHGTLTVGGEPVETGEEVWIAVAPPGLDGALHPGMWELRPPHEGEDVSVGQLVRVTAPDGTVHEFVPGAKLFDDAVITHIAEGDWAVWNIVHLGGPDHPMHIHATHFQMVQRLALPRGADGRIAGFDPATGRTEGTPAPAAAGRPIDDVAAGPKDTWVVRSGEWVRVAGCFAEVSGSYMYHCHILDHEDHTMMRPFVVLPAPLLALHAGHGRGGDHGGHSGHSGHGSP